MGNNKHGLKGTRIYMAWENMKYRCHNPNHKQYKDYGGRGITVCDQWIDDAEQFYLDMGHPPKGMTLERIDNNKGYSPENCRWATRKEQQNNQRSNINVTLWNVTHNITEWCRILNRNYRTVKNRISRGWSTQTALTTPTKKQFKEGE